MKGSGMGYSRKNANMGGGGGGPGYTFLETPAPLNPPRNFKIFHFALRNSRENKLSPLEILQNCITPLGNSKVKNQDTWKIRMIFS